ncbi:molecular chaperone [Vibrio sp. UCD-FRSSP16_10]|uniref:molecular chaperone n=1 Tax=unclassified Vibrio TaxID=2614977 RepID=UPI0007FDBB7B|nr:MULTISPECIES: molecular chaperone [unclassified Vibrio]OBT16360.1 molecular chaperone [Vibrio sp. UCD-FRSSP16_30]OBT21224.1 molecular chaperone [Vibrio sp. UCD-FRSSP16_10]
MAIGFDYGTANCSVAHIIDNQAIQIPLANGDKYISSTLCAPTSEALSEYLYKRKNILPATPHGESILQRAIRTNREEGIDVMEEEFLFGQAALDLYLQDPKDVYYIKSPKSFLGARGLRDAQLAFFEDLVCAMMENVKSQAEQSLGKTLTDTVIGRPVNFLGRGGEESNQQAQDILLRAASRAGFKNIEFQFEPVAAGLDYESTLHTDKNVLVVDIGGGTTDCSMIQMGPSWFGKSDRKQTLLGHTGQLVGGNDLDIHIAYKQFMTELGRGSRKQSGLEIPISQFWHSILINNVQAQRDFYAKENLAVLKQLQREALEPAKLARMLEVHQGALGYSIVSEAEQTKIALCENSDYLAQLRLLSETVEIPVLQQEMERAIEVPKEKITKLVLEAVQQSQITPDVVFMTGGSARSRVLQQAVKSVLPNVPIVSGNYFGSVTAGLARWADICFK